MFIFELTILLTAFILNTARCTLTGKKRAECAPGDDETSLAGNVNLGPLSDRTTV
jgi:hypothetical protein